MFNLILIKVNYVTKNILCKGRKCWRENIYNTLTKNEIYFHVCK